MEVANYLGISSGVHAALKGRLSSSILLLDRVGQHRMHSVVHMMRHENTGCVMKVINGLEQMDKIHQNGLHLHQYICIDSSATLEKHPGTPRPERLSGTL
ncbi:hypothetical protein J6590_097959 [Homalodisca vitripennis]|nr:hypothetical protein J6590_097959 [Homalodisca vitripennis]